jgi:hypothetical protein
MRPHRAAPARGRGLARRRQRPIRFLRIRSHLVSPPILAARRSAISVHRVRCAGQQRAWREYRGIACATSRRSAQVAAQGIWPPTTLAHVLLVQPIQCAARNVRSASSTAIRALAAARGARASLSVSVTCIMQGGQIPRGFMADCTTAANRSSLTRGPADAGVVQASVAPFMAA